MCGQAHARFPHVLTHFVLGANLPGDPLFYGTEEWNSEILNHIAKMCQSSEEPIHKKAFACSATAQGQSKERNLVGVNPSLRKQKPEDLSNFSQSASLPATIGIWIGGAGCSLRIWGPCLIFSQVIGALPWVVNSASVATPAPAQSLQVQAVTPQLLLNAQGQVIATLASSPLPQPVAVRKPNTPESPAKSEVPGLGDVGGHGKEILLVIATSQK